MRLWRVLSERRILRQSRRRCFHRAPLSHSPKKNLRTLWSNPLYPDALIALILPASTMPSDLVLAERYIASNGDLTQIANQPWDDSVKSLTRRASDQARCIVRAGGLRERDAGCPRLVRKFRLVIPSVSFWERVVSGWSSRAASREECRIEPSKRLVFSSDGG